MLVISHRGNIDGANKFLENNPLHIQTLLNLNIQVEIDVWFEDSLILLGHDEPQHTVSLDFLRQNGLWCHAKNLNALHCMLEQSIKNCFWHQEDNYTLTSNGTIWAYPGQPTTTNTIIVDTSRDWKTKEYSCKGVCVDYL